jgi:long-chain acyl-CoA synthetase
MKPEQRGAILSCTRLEWMLADLALMLAGGATTAVFSTTGAEECAFILSDSEATIAFADDAAQVAKLVSIRDRIPSVRRVVAFDGIEASPDGWVQPLAAFEAEGEAAAERNPGAVSEAVAAIGPERLASLIYTSGTTGQPKGAMHTHESWIYEAEAVDALGLVTPADRQYLFLPLAHVFARVLAITAVRLGIPTALEPDTGRLLPGLAEVRPTFFAGVPRVFEKISDRLCADIAANRGLKWAYEVGRQLRALELTGRRPSPWLRTQAALADRMLFSRVRETFGGRLRFAISGAAPLPVEAGEILAGCGIPILEGYGLTESAAASCVNRLDDWRIGSVGPPVPGCELAFADDGEILLRSPGVMKGYWGRPEETALALDGEGWLRTGDIGQLDHGHLRITDRKKELIVTAGGKKVAPSLVERLLERSPLIAHAVLIGDRRPYCVALVALEPDGVERLARDRQLSWASREDWAKDPVIRAELDHAVADINRALSPWEMVKKIGVIAELPTEADGSLTASGKVRRRVVEQRHADEIAALYGGG